jgi:pSer/pThr/pTyr-binding forkhead associated (FHA) protein
VNLQKRNELERAGWLDPGQTLELGPLTVRLHDDTPIADWVASGFSRPYPPGTIQPSSLQVFGRGSSTVWKMKRPLALVGSSAACKVRLDDAQISQFHCALVKTPLGLWAVDLLSTNGMTLNGRNVRVAALRDGDVLRIGDFTICPEYRSSHHSSFESTRSTPMLVQSETAGSAPLAHTVAPMLNMEHSSGAMEGVQGSNGQITNDALVSSLAMQLTQMQHQFCAQMQHQMADQFQQLMGLFAEAFWGMQREQSTLVRRELKRIRRLTSQLSSLKTELGKVPAVTTDQPAARKLSKNDELGLPQCANSESPKTPIQQGAKTSADPEASSPSKKKPQAVFLRPSETMSKSPEEMHSWLHARVNEIQKERTSSWQRIFDLIRKKTPAEKPVAPVQSAPAGK